MRVLNKRLRRCDTFFKVPMTKHNSSLFKHSFVPLFMTLGFKEWSVPVHDPLLHNVPYLKLVLQLCYNFKVQQVQPGVNLRLDKDAEFCCWTLFHDYCYSIFSLKLKTFLFRMSPLNRWKGKNTVQTLDIFYSTWKSIRSFNFLPFHDLISNLKGISPWQDSHVCLVAVCFSQKVEMVLSRKSGQSFKASVMSDLQGACRLGNKCRYHSQGDGGQIIYYALWLLEGHKLHVWLGVQNIFYREFSFLCFFNLLVHTLLVMHDHALVMFITGHTVCFKIPNHP